MQTLFYKSKLSHGHNNSWGQKRQSDKPPKKNCKKKIQLKKHPTSHQSRQQNRRRKKHSWNLQAKLKTKQSPSQANTVWSYINVELYVYLFVFVFNWPLLLQYQPDKLANNLTMCLQLPTETIYQRKQAKSQQHQQ